MTRKYVYAGGVIIAELDNSNNLKKEYVRGLSLGGGIGGILYCKDDQSNFYYYHYDGNGNVTSVTDGTKKEVAIYEYDAFGNVLTEAGSLSNECKFSTEQADKRGQLIDLGFRWYDPEIGRWTQGDPLGAAGGLNLYAYCAANPVNGIDPFGLQYVTYDIGVENPNDCFIPTGSAIQEHGPGRDQEGCWGGPYGPIIGPAWDDFKDLLSDQASYLLSDFPFGPKMVMVDVGPAGSGSEADGSGDLGIPGLYDEGWGAEEMGSKGQEFWKGLQEGASELFRGMTFRGGDPNLAFSRRMGNVTTSALATATAARIVEWKTGYRVEFHGVHPKTYDRTGYLHYPHVQVIRGAPRGLFKEATWGETVWRFPNKGWRL